MASIKFLKKQISSVADYLAANTLMSKAEISEDDVLKINSILAEVYEFEEEYRRRAAHYDARSNSKLVKKYFSNLYKEINEKAEDITNQIIDLNK